MSRLFRISLAMAIVLIAQACSVTPNEQASGARPEIILEGVDGVFQPARGIDRGGPAIVDGQVYRATGPFPVRIRDVPRSAQAMDVVGNLERRGGGRMEAPLPDHVMDRLRAEALLLPPSAAIEDPTARGQFAADATSGTGFASIDYTECCGGGGSVPPDPELAAGPNHLIAVVNVAFEIYDTNGTSLVGPTTLASFFSSVPACIGVFDPNVNYDEDADRFIMGIDADGGDYCIAVSQTGDPTGNWSLYSFPTANNRDFFDYPHLGVGDDAIFMGANIFGRRNFKEGRIWAIDKAAMYADANSPSVVSFSTGSDGTPQPMNARGALQGTWPSGAPHYILTDGQSFDGRNYGVWSWSNPFGGGSPSKQGEVDLNLASGETAGSPVDQPQLGGGNIQANDWRVQDAEYRDGFIWMSNAQACNPGGGTVNCARWAQIDPTGPSVAAAGIVGSSGEYRSFPDLAVDACGNMMMGYSKTSSSMYPGVYAVGLDNTGVLGTEIQVKAGEISYTSFEQSAPRRWGDYTEMTIAPDGSTFWYLGEYSKNTGTSDGRWGTYINSFTFNCDSGNTNQSPNAVITLIDCDSATRECSFDGSGSSDPEDGNVASYSWAFGDGSSGSGATTTHTYAAYDTDYTVRLTVADSELATDFAEETIRIDNPVGSSSMSVASVLVDTVNRGGGNKSPRATVTVRDNQGNAVSGVTVTGDFTGSINDPGLNGGTNGSGVATITSTQTKKGKLNAEFCVSNISGGSLSWDGVVTCGNN